MNLRRKFIITVLVLACLLGLPLCLRTTEVPNVTRLVDLAGAETNIELTPEFYPPYDLLIGVPSTPEGLPRFVGTLHVTSSDGRTVAIAIDSRTTKESNWLQGSTQTGYILGWGRQPLLSEFLQPRKSHRLRISFEGAPPTGSSFWFSSMRHVTIFGDRKVR